MLTIADILSPERIRCGAEAGSKKRALEALSELIVIGAANTQPRTACDCLMARERLGSTGFGFGVAIPHGRVAGLEQAVGGFLQLSAPVDFDALDGQPVDLIFGLLVPEHSTDEHLQILSQLAEAFGDSGLLEELRATDSADTAFALLTQAITQP
ncbi:MAG: PTS IIA-like nitrogen-regulatory protein PtsN [Gammaproteobacteria bacterium]|nr:MAG: PTS IIA-like nitrogen-regulatory protein PtsN [Gammaproteobacteria bacterium]